MSRGEIAIWVGLVFLAVAFVAGIARRRTFPGGTALLAGLLVVIAAAAAVLIGLLAAQ